MFGIASSRPSRRHGSTTSCRRGPSPDGRRRRMRCSAVLPAFAGWSTCFAKRQPMMAARFDSPVGRYIHIELEGVEPSHHFEEAARASHPASSTRPAPRRAVAASLRGRTDHGELPPDRLRLPFHESRCHRSTVNGGRRSTSSRRRRSWRCPSRWRQALELERPVYMGCSIGGLLALDLAATTGRFRAVIGWSRR